MATSLGLPISLTFFLLLLTKAISTDTTSFSFTKFHSNQPNLILQGDALVTSTGKLQLTSVDDNGIPTSNSLGRAIYTSPIHLWDNTTGNVASIVTSFAINISAPYKSTSAEGLAFFFAPVNSQAQNGAGYLGLFNSYKTDKTQQTVAVEIDTKPDDDWDPQNRHIGIDVNSIKSIKTASWGMANGQVATILITYDPYTKLLVASLVHASRRTSYILSETVDLKSVLPEYVSVGFSATTGVSEEYVETHDVLSWSFVSKLPDGSKDSLWNDADLVSYVMHGTM